MATKFVRILRAGVKASKPDELLDCPVWVLHAPGGPPSLLLSLVLEAGLPVQGKIIAALDDRAGSEQFRVLQEMGARTATFWAAAQGADLPFLVEGEAVAANQVRELLRRAGLPSLRLREGAKSLFVTASGLARALPVPLLESIVRCLEMSGASRPVAQRIALHWTGLQMRAYAASGRKAWMDPVRGGQRGRIELGLDSLRADEPALAATLEQALTLCQQLMKPAASVKRKAASKG